MAVPFLIPPWFNQPNPVETYQRGIQIGSAIGQEQAANQMRQEALDREQQKQAFEDELQKAKFQLQSDAMARQYSAQSDYQRMVNSGVDPRTALLKLGPAMGITGPALAQFARDTQQFPLTTETRGGEDFVRTGPHSWEHIPKTKTLPDYKEYHNSDGTVTRVHADGTTETLGTPIPKATTVHKARYTFKKDNGDTITGTTDDPEIKRLVDEQNKKRLDEESAKNAPAKPGMLSTLHDALFGAPPPLTNASPFKILSITKKDQAAPAPSDTSDEEE